MNTAFRRVLLSMLGTWVLLSGPIEEVSAYTPLLTRHEHLIRWDLDESPQGQPNIIEGAVEFFVNRVGTPDITDNGDGTGGEFDILRTAFRVWHEQPTSNIRFNDLKLTNQTSITGTDFTNIILFDETNQTGFFPPGTGIIAITLNTFEDEELDGVFDGRMGDTDLVFNGGDFVFSKGLIPGRMNLMAVAVHEIGHICGLDHAFTQKTVESDNSVLVPSMYPYILYANDKPAVLKQDDIAGAVELYERDEINDLLNGTISGLVRLDGEPVFGVDIVAYQGDTPVVSATTRTDGTYRIYGVPAGSYTLRALTLSPGNVNTFHSITTGFHSQYYHPSGAAGLSSDASTVTVIAAKRRSNLNFNLESSSGPDFFEPNENSGQATLLMVDGPRMIQQPHRLGDADWVSFAAEQDMVYQLVTDNLAFFADPVLELYAPNGALLAQVDDINAPEGNFAAEIQFAASTTGTHSVRLLSRSTLTGAGASCEFSIRKVGSKALDANEDGRIDALDLFALGQRWQEDDPARKAAAPFSNGMLLELIEALKQ
jgi:hypothetical protein